MPHKKLAQVLFAFFSILTALINGCSNPNSEASFNPDTGGHPGAWLPAAHMLMASSDIDWCASCHGADLGGGISGVSCTSCHMGSPTSVHPADWVPLYGKHGSYVTMNGSSSCSNQYCHGSSLAGVENSGPSCTNCHMGGITAIHPAAWTGGACSDHGNYAYENGTAGCANIYCHGDNLGGVQDSGPSCTQCHSSVPDSNQCNYCHGRSSDGMPDGTIFPNRIGNHAEHMQITGITCATCHSRSCRQHADGFVDVAFDPAGPSVGSASPAPVFDPAAKTCLNIACHMVPAGMYSYYFPDGSGGAELKTVNVYGNTNGVTPSWYANGTGCTACHCNPPRDGTDGSDIWHSGYHGNQGPTGDYNQCQLCHSDASSPDNGIGDTITDPTLHRNGTFNVDPKFTAQHCFGCH